MNLASNVSFEADPAEDYRADGPGSFTWANDVAHRDTHSLKIEANASDALSRWFSRGRVDAVPGATYEASVHLMTQDMKGGRVYVAINFWDRDGNHLGTKLSEGVIAAGGWQQLSVSSPAPADAASVRVELRLSGGGSVWFDSLSLIRK